MFEQISAAVSRLTGGAHFAVGGVGAVAYAVFLACQPSPNWQAVLAAAAAALVAFGVHDALPDAPPAPEKPPGNSSPTPNP